VANYLDINNSGLPRENAFASAGGGGSANKPPQLDGSGLLPADMLPAGVEAQQDVLPASENLSAGDFVNIWDDTGTLKVRQADASDPTKRADGFVNDAVTMGNNATVLRSGLKNTGVSALTAGSRYFLSETAGGVTTTPPSTSGAIVQSVGIALASDELVTDIDESPLVRA